MDSRRPWALTTILGMSLACGVGDSGSAGPEPSRAASPRPADEAEVRTGGDVDCSLVVIATVPVDARGGSHHVQGRLVLEGCREESEAYAAAVGEAAKRHFEGLVEVHSFMAVGICLDPAVPSKQAAEFYSGLRTEIAQAANRAAGQELVRKVGCSGMTSAEYF